MSIIADINILKEMRVVPKGGEKLYESALEHSDLVLSDYQTIRDITALCNDPFDIHIHTVLIGLFQSLADGSLCMELDPSAWKLMKWLTECGGSTVEQLGGAVELLQASGVLKKADGEGLSDIPAVPLIVQENQYKERRRFIYFQKGYAAEKKLRECLNRLLKNRKLDPVKNKSVEEIKNAVADVCKCTGNPLDPLQLAAVTASLYKNFLIISGGPGTGKTSTAAALIRSMVRLGINAEKILLTAPTGRAAQRLMESIRTELKAVEHKAGKNLSLEDRTLLDTLESKTIHRAINYSPHHNRFFYNKKRNLPAELILVDEVSMVDVFIMGNLLEAVKAGARIIFLGDRYQLPSVDAGAVLEDLIPKNHAHAFSKDFITACNDISAAAGISHSALNLPDKTDDIRQDRIVILEKSWRSGKSILIFSNYINSGGEGKNPADGFPVLPEQNTDWPKAGKDDNDGILCLLKEQKAADVWQRQLEEWAETYYGLEANTGEYRNLVRSFEHAGEEETSGKLLIDIFRMLGTAQILTFVHAGMDGELWINRTLGRFMRDRLDKNRRDERNFNGASIIITANDYSNKLFNGDTGVILKQEGEYRAWFYREGEYKPFPVKSLPGWEPAWAITVHKSQGSEYDNVLLVLPSDREHRMLTKEILYTGVTRAKHTVVIRGEAETIKIGAARSIDRESGIELW